MRPLLVGESNPYGRDPYFALWPGPVNSAGWRLCHKILGMERAAYLAAFDRVNLCAGDWSRAEARRAAERVLRERRAAVALGARVADALGVEYRRPFRVVELPGGQRVAVLPHPSGRCRAWNDPDSYRRARETVLTLMALTGEGEVT